MKKIKYFLILQIFFVPLSCFADLVQKEFWITDGTVYDIEANDTNVYIGGAFNYIGPNTGGGAILDSQNAATQFAYPYIAGNVFSAISDQQGGWYIGGNFTAVGSISQQNIAHILADGTIDQQWLPQVNGPVYSIVLSDNTLFVGGQFDSVDGQNRNNIASINTDASSDSNYVLDWNPNVQGFNMARVSVNTMLLAGNALYVGGYFDTIDNTTRNNLAAISITNTQPGSYLTSWNPNIALTNSLYEIVNALTFDGANTLYVGGRFDTVDGISRNHLVALNLDAQVSGDYLIDWNPGVISASHVKALVLSNDLLYVGGNVGGVDNTGQHYLFALRTDAINRGEYITDWRPNIDVSTYQDAINTMVLVGNTLYVGGDVRIQTSTEERRRLFALNVNAVNENEYLVPWNPGVNDSVHVISYAENKIFIGGRFASIGGVQQKNIAKLDPQTGEVINWDPTVNGPVTDLNLKNDALYMAGTFTSVDDQLQNSFVILDTIATAPGEYIQAPRLEINDWEYVRALLIDNNTLFLGGSFNMINNTPRSDIAAIDLATNSLTPLDINTDHAASVNSLAIDGDILYFAGSFTTVNGQVRDNIASVNIGANNAMGVLTDWAIDFNGTPRDMLIYNNKLIVGGAVHSTMGQWLLGMSVFNLNPDGVPSLTDWYVRFNGGTVHTFDILDNVIFAGGEFIFIDNNRLSPLAALDFNNTTPGHYVYDWNPQIEADPITLRSADVFAVKIHNNVLYAGGFFKHMNGKPAGHLAAYDIHLPLDKIVTVTPPPGDGTGEEPQPDENTSEDPPVENPEMPNDDGTQDPPNSNDDNSGGTGSIYFPLLFVMACVFFLRRKKHDGKVVYNNW